MRLRRLSIVAVLCAAPAAARTPPEFADLFSYDARAPLDVREAKIDRRGGAEVHDLSYASPRGGRVPAYLVVPPGPGPFAGLVYLHWGQGNRSELLAEALLAARAGAASILIDAPYRRPEYQRTPCGEAVRADFVQLITDLRRAVDVLLARAPVDGRRLGYVGHSLGATWGGTLAAVEPRLRALVLMGGLPSLAEAMREDARDKHRPPEEVRKLEACVAPLEAIESIHHVHDAAPAALFFQFARVDRYISPAAARRYFEAASEPKSQAWYEGGHEFSDPAALGDRLRWLEKRLALAPVRPILTAWMGLDR
jgi:dienelactone hydrolase